MIFVDANVPMYLVGGEHPHKLDAQRILERLVGERHRLVTSSEVLQEIMHRYVSANRRDWVEPAFNALRAFVDEVFAVRRRQITEILSFDSGFDEIVGITRLPASLPLG